MPKPKLTLRLRLASYRPPRNRWRRAVDAAAADRRAESGIRYGAGDRLEVLLRLCFDHAGSLLANDVDNRLKDVLDALQGSAGGAMRIQILPPIIPNDRQVFRVVVEKALAPKQSGGLGHLIVRKYRDTTLVNMPLEVASVHGARPAPRLASMRH